MGCSKGNQSPFRPNKYNTADKYDTQDFEMVNHKTQNWFLFTIQHYSLQCNEDKHLQMIVIFKCTLFTDGKVRDPIISKKLRINQHSHLIQM